MEKVKIVDVQMEIGFGTMKKNAVRISIQLKENFFDWFLLETLGECPSNWFVGNNGKGCFFVTHTQLNFTDANLWCHSSQGRLLEISQNDLFVALQSTTQFSFRVNDFYWIGLRETGPNLSNIVSILFDADLLFEL